MVQNFPPRTLAKKSKENQQGNAHHMTTTRDATRVCDPNRRAIVLALRTNTCYGADDLACVLRGRVGRHWWGRGQSVGGTVHVELVLFGSRGRHVECCLGRHTPRGWGWVQHVLMLRHLSRGINVSVFEGKSLKQDKEEGRVGGEEQKGKRN